MEMKTLEATIQKAMARGEKYRVSNERLEEAANALETEIFEVLKNAGVEKPYIITIGFDNGNIIEEVSYKFTDSTYVAKVGDGRNELDGDCEDRWFLYWNIVTYDYEGVQDSRRDGKRKDRLNFLKRGKVIIEAIGARLEALASEVDQTLE